MKRVQRLINEGRAMHEARAAGSAAPACSAAPKREPGPAEKRAIQYIADMLAGRK
jgi:hypothetical protein